MKQNWWYKLRRKGLVWIFDSVFRLDPGCYLPWYALWIRNIFFPGYIIQKFANWYCGIEIDYSRRTCIIYGREFSWAFFEAFAKPTGKLFRLTEENGIVCIHEVADAAEEWVGK